MNADTSSELTADSHCRRILVAVDDSARAPDVVAAADELARALGASIRLFQAVSVFPEFPPAAHVEARDPLAAYLREEARRRLDGLKANVRAASCDIQVEESGSPWHAILAAAEQYGADLIVLGSHGYTALDRVLGTTAAKIANRACRNVLVVHRRSAASVVAPPTPTSRDR